MDEMRARVKWLGGRAAFWTATAAGCLALAVLVSAFLQTGSAASAGGAGSRTQEDASGAQGSATGRGEELPRAFHGAPLATITTDEMLQEVLMRATVPPPEGDRRSAPMALSNARCLRLWGIEAQRAGADEAARPWLTIRALYVASRLFDIQSSNGSLSGADAYMVCNSYRAATEYKDQHRATLVREMAKPERGGREVWDAIVDWWTFVGEPPKRLSELYGDFWVTDPRDPITKKEHAESYVFGRTGNDSWRLEFKSSDASVRIEWRENGRVTEWKTSLGKMQ